MAAPAMMPRGMATYISDATVFDGRTLKTRQGVFVSGGEIAWTGAHARAPRVAQAAHQVDGAGRTVTPGLIDCHVHLCFDGTADFAGEAREMTDTLAVLKMARNAVRHLDRGVTTVRDLGGRGSSACEFGLAVERGLARGPRIVAAGRALTITGGHGHSIGIAREVDGPDAVRQAVREEIRDGARTIKVIATGGVLTPGITADFTAFTPEEIAAAVDEAHKWGRTVAAHAIGEGGIVQAVLAGVDSIEHGSQISAEAARFMKEAGTFHVATIGAIRGIVEHPDEVPAYAVEKATALAAQQRDAFRRAVRAGVRHAVGTDAGTPFNPHGGAPREIVRMVEWGLTPLKAMQAATSNAAALLRLPDLGAVQAGRAADLCVYEGDPVEEIERILEPAMVLKAGELVAGELL
jgi:imidazolonepropionase-like amidohydrolase